MPRTHHSNTRQSAPDLDEIAPNRFLVRNSHAAALLKGEGTLVGRMFELTTWRRDGLLARLRERRFVVRTLIDRIADLPGPPPAPPIGEPIWRPLASEIEQFSRFDPESVSWRSIDVETRDGVAGVALWAGWVLRRRKGRGASSYHLAFRERGGSAGLRPLDETSAILTGYAQAREHDPRAWLVRRAPASSAAPADDGILLPGVVLPPPHREVLAILTQATADGPLVPAQAWPLAQALFGRLGIRLTIEDSHQE